MPTPGTHHTVFKLSKLCCYSSSPPSPPPISSVNAIKSAAVQHMPMAMVSCAAIKKLQYHRRKCTFPTYLPCQQSALLLYAFDAVSCLSFCPMPCHAMPCQVIKLKPSGEQYTYFLHYMGWNSRWDKWVIESDLMKEGPQAEEMQKQLKKEKMDKVRLVCA